MSIDVEMPEISVKTSRFGRLRAEGGWIAKAPEVRPKPNDEVFRAWAKYQLGEFGSAEAAEADVAERIQRGVVAWLRDQLAYSIRGWLRRYAEMFPALVNEDGTIDGFDAEEMQGCYFPFDSTGRAGKPFAREMLRKMGRGARENE